MIDWLTLLIVLGSIIGGMVIAYIVIHGWEDTSK